MSPPSPVICMPVANATAVTTESVITERVRPTSA